MSHPSSAPAQTRKLLFEALGVSVVEFACSAQVEGEGPEEPNPNHSIVLVRRGVFRRARGRERVLADPNHVLFFNAAEPYRYAHPVPGGDLCTVLAIETGHALELVARHAPLDAEDPRAPFRRGHALSDSRIAALHYELLCRLRKPQGRLPLEDLLAELADQAVRAAYRGDDPRVGRECVSAAVRRRRRDLAETAMLAINARLHSPPNLTQLAGLCGCSPFHLSRTFRETVGISLRRYSRRLRVLVAADRLAGGAPDLTRLGLELGYADHSHFTNTFRREWGRPPSQFRAWLGG